MKFSTITKVIIGSALVASTLSVANARNMYKDMPCRPMLKDGFYLGALAGYDAFRLHQSFSDADNSFSMTGSLTGWTGGLFAGYGQYFQNYYYLGGEILANYNGQNQTVMSASDNDGDNNSQRAKAEGTFGIAILPGLKLQDTVLGYLRLGYNWTRFNSSYSSFDAGDGSTVSVSSNKTEGGFDAGIGLEALLTDNWSMRTEYNHVWYNSANLISPPAGSANTEISDNQFNVGFVYHIS